MSRVFIPSDDNELVVPFIEDARADFAPFYNVSKSIKSIEGEVLAELAKLGAGGFIVPGKFIVDGLPRYGYELRFSYQGGQGVIRVAGLPIRSAKPSETKIQQVKKQALSNLREWLKCAVTMQIFGDKGAALLPYMLVDDKQTVGDVLMSTGTLPALEPGGIPLMGEVVE